MSIGTSFVKIWIACSCEFKTKFLNFLVFIPLAFWSRNYWGWLYYKNGLYLIKAKSILVGNLNSGLSYTTVK